MNGRSGQFEALDLLTIFSVALQMQDHDMATAQGAAGDRMAETLSEVLDNQKEIMSILSDIRADLSALKESGVA